MRNTQGFLLLSFVVYMTIFSYIASLIWYTATAFVIPSIMSTRRYQAYMSLHIATDLFVHDVRMFSCNKLKLAHATATELVWHAGQCTDNKNIGWRYAHNKLERIEGIYGDNGWKTKRTHCVANAVKHVLFTIDQGITIILTPAIDEMYEVTSYVAFDA